ncbi:hypothetical protein DYB32_009251 [Aphanomyces invadans]|uniref:Uncharacterized protein n=1 Tax=Aphanomyces invadans TaxID=157072 RepID=A0A3R7CUA4_9STRA|nr:hypothetical protein DYB32_009251 [Aphanomyces invadans]
MQAYRNRERSEVEALKLQVEALEHELATRLVKRTPPTDPDNTRWPLALPWKEVAAAMHAMCEDAHSKQRALQYKSEEAEAVRRDLQEWVASFHNPTASLSSWSRTWRDVTLLAHPRSRQLGKEWITQHMYHNSSRIFRQQECPPTHYSIIDNSWDIDFSSGECYYIVERGHVDWNMPLENVQSMFRNHLCSMFTLDAFCPLTAKTLTEATGNTVLHRLVMPNGDDAAPKQYVNLLGAEFNEPDNRTVVVVTQIQDDEAATRYASSLPQRSRMTWVELHGEAPNRTRGRYVSIVSQQFTKAGGFISMVDEARAWGHDLTEVNEWEQDDLFLRLHRIRNEGLKSSRQQWYSSIINHELAHCHGI